jgi:uncharacterized coiled-coil protein SlyX
VQAAIPAEKKEEQKKPFAGQTDTFEEIAASISGLGRKLDKALSAVAATGEERIKKAAQQQRSERQSAEAVQNLAREIQLLNDNLAKQTRSLERTIAGLDELVKKIDSGHDEIISHLRDLSLKEARRKRRFRLFG